MTTTKKERTMVYDVTELDLETGETHVIGSYPNQDDALTYIEVRRSKRKKGDRIMHGIKRRFK